MTRPQLIKAARRHGAAEVRNLFKNPGAAQRARQARAKVIAQLKRTARP